MRLLHGYLDILRDLEASCLSAETEFILVFFKCPYGISLEVVEGRVSTQQLPNPRMNITMGRDKSVIV